MASENTEEPEHKTSASQNTHGNGNPSETNSGRMMPVHVESLRGPEHEDGEEISSGDEGDDESQAEDSRFLIESGWKHREFGAIHFPHAETNQQGCAQKEWHQNVGRGPAIL